MVVGLLLIALSVAFAVGWYARGPAPKKGPTVADIARERQRLQEEIAEAVAKHQPRADLKARLRQLTLDELRRAA